MTLKAPERKPDAIDGTQDAFDADHPSTARARSTDLFAQIHGDPDDGDDEAESEGGETDVVTDVTAGAEGEVQSRRRSRRTPVEVE